jgi:hypothetical protein
MAKTSLMQGMLIALILSVVSIPLMLGLTVLGLGMANQVLTAILAGVYLAYMLVQSTSRVGRATLGVMSVAVLVGACFWGASTWLVMLLAVGLIWLVRSLLNYASLVPVIMDGLLCVVSVGCAVGALIVTGNVFLTVWSFFLPQALCVFIPRRLKRSGRWCASMRAKAKQEANAGKFAQAHRAAEEAIRCLAQCVAG